MPKPIFFNKHIYWLLLLLMPVKTIIAQISISGPTCTVAGMSYSYNASGSFDGSTSMTWCVPTTATILQAYGSNVVYNGSCVTGNGVGSIVVRFNSAGGPISLTTSAGNASPLNVTMVPALSPGAITSGKTQSIAYNTIPAAINCSVATNGSCSPSYSYQWMSSTDNVSYTAISEATSQNLTFSTGLLQTAYYKRRVTELTTSTTLYSDVATVTVYPPFSSVTISPASQNIYTGTSAATISGPAATGGNCGGAYTYQWQSSSDGTNFTNITSATGLNYSPGVLTTTAWYRRKDACGSDVSFSNTVVVNVYQHVSSSSITPATQTISYNSFSALIGNATPTGGMCGVNYAYQWQQSSDGTNFADITGATGPNYNAPRLTAPINYFKRKIVCASETIYSNVVTIIVNPLLIPGTTTPSSMTIPPHTSPGTLVTTPASGGGCGGSYSYQWQQSTDGSTYTDVTGATSQNYTPVALTSTTWFRRKATCSIDIAYTVPIQVTVSATNLQSLNYIKERVLSRPVSDSATSDSTISVTQSTSFFDGLGRLAQMVDWQASPAQKDMVSVTSYDRFNREPAKFMPYTSAASDGNFKTNAFSEQYNFNAGQFPNDQLYYERTDFDLTPMHDPLAKYAPGSSWSGSGRGTVVKYWGNTATDAVRIWTVTDVAGSFGAYATTTTYSPGMLHKNVMVDERGVQTIEFKDLDGKLILKKVQLTATADDGSGRDYTGWLCTYYIYDDFNQLRCVIQPNGTQLLVANSWDINALNGDILNEQCFRFEYDQRNRLIIKKSPGAGEVWAVYDALDRMVMTQDANLRSLGKWQVTQYDILDRISGTGLLTDANNLAYHQNLAYGSTNYPNTSSNYELLTQIFYDDYSWASALNPSPVITLASQAKLISTYNVAPDYAVAPNFYMLTRGKPTGAKIKVLGTTNTFLTTLQFFDDHGRIQQTQSTNYTGGMDTLTTQYNFRGKPLRILLNHQKAGNTAQHHDILTKISYDAQQRTKAVWKNIDGAGKDVFIDSVQYNELSQLRAKYLGSAIDSLIYDYNIRGWLTGINKQYVGGGANHYFGEELGYDIPSSVTGASYVPQYNGNIAGLTWKTTGDSTKRKYDFAYDNANRLTAANFLQNTGSGWSNSLVDYTVGNLTYDANGNIQSMNQSGFKWNGSALIDQLTYSYKSNSNKLIQVTDAANDPLSKLGDFHYAGTKLPTDYNYDGNGNLSSDNNKAIDTVIYNHLDLPQLVHVTGKGNIQFTYDAHGNKLTKTSTDSLSRHTTTTLYLGGFVYQQTDTITNPSGGIDTLQFFMHEQGRMRWALHNYLNGTAQYGWENDLFEKDHQENTRVVLTMQKDTSLYAATMEAAYRAKENALFYNIPQTSYSRTLAGYPVDLSMTNPNDSVIMVNGTAGRTQGPAIILKVMAGDTIDLGAKSYYTNLSGKGTNSSITDVLASLANGIIGITGGNKGTFTQLNTTSGPLYGALNSFMTNKDGTIAGKPRAYLNWMLLDDQYQYDGIKSGALAVGNTTAGVLNTLAQSGIVAGKNGFLYVWVSNETQGWPVFFDNLSVQVRTGPILEETHYYPFGLTMAGISDKALKAHYNENKYKYDGGTELQNNEFSDGSGLEMYSTEYRLYDPQLGRFFQIDEMAEYVESESPYDFANNNPILLNDPTGLLSTPDNPENLQEVTVTTKYRSSNPLYDLVRPLLVHAPQGLQNAVFDFTRLLEKQLPKPAPAGIGHIFPKMPPGYVDHSWRILGEAALWLIPWGRVVEGVVEGGILIYRLVRIGRAVETVVAASRFAELIYASKFGIKAYKVLSKIKPVGTHVHHLIEKRFAQLIGLAKDDIPSIVVTPEEHQVFTNAWRDRIGYENSGALITTQKATKEQVLQAAREIYKDYPEVLDALNLK